MARRKSSRLYRKAIDLHVESTGSAGNWNTIGYLKKLQEFQSAYIDYIKINWILKDVDGTGGTSRLAPVTGVMFLVNNTTDSPDAEPDNTISCKAGSHSGQVVLQVKRRIVDNDADESRNDGRLYIWMKNTDFTADDTVHWHCFVEVYGRWHDIVTP